MKAILKYINEKLTDLKINYAFKKWNKEIVYPYFVGDIKENEPTEEDQFHEYDFTIRGFLRNGTYDELLTVQDQIENLFSYHTTTLDNGSGVVISYTGMQLLDEEELKRIEIYLKIEEWRVK